MRRAWVFNLSRERLVATVLEPWHDGRRFALGDRKWEPSESEIRILQGPPLEPVDLAHGQGPNAAERTAQDVSAALLAAAADRAGGRARAAAAELLAELAALDDVSPDNEQALGLVAERLRSLGLG